MKTFTKEIIAERKAQPTTPYWESVIRKCKRFKKSFTIFGLSLVGIKAALAAVELPFMNDLVEIPPQVDKVVTIIVIIGWCIAIVGFLIGQVAEFIASLTVAEPDELTKS